MKDSDPGETGSKWSELYNCPSLPQPINFKVLEPKVSKTQWSLEVLQVDNYKLGVWRKLKEVDFYSIGHYTEELFGVLQRIFIVFQLNTEHLLHMK